MSVMSPVRLLSTDNCIAIGSFIAALLGIFRSDILFLLHYFTINNNMITDNTACVRHEQKKKKNKEHNKNKFD